LKIVKKILKVVCALTGACVVRLDALQDSTEGFFLAVFVRPTQTPQQQQQARKRLMEKRKKQEEENKKEEMERGEETELKKGAEGSEGVKGALFCAFFASICLHLSGCVLICLDLF
jgi:thiol:disulfide interchange protein